MASVGSYISLFTHRHTERCRWEILPKMAAHEQSVLGLCLEKLTLQSKGSCSMASGGSYISLFTHRHTGRCRWEILPKMAAHEQSVLGLCLEKLTLQSKGSCSMGSGGSYISLFTHRHTERCRWEILPKMAALEQSVLGPCLEWPTLQSKGVLQHGMWRFIHITIYSPAYREVLGTGGNGCREGFTPGLYVGLPPSDNKYIQIRGDI